MRARIPAAVVFLSAMALAPSAHAQNAAAADALFQKGKEAFDAKRYAEACPAFAESYRLDPVSGSLVALASCYEADGKLASAWSKYGELASLADREGKKERADAARQRVKELEPKLAKLTITVAPDAASIAGLEVKRDGTTVGAPSFGTAIPVDRGEHVIEASAPGRRAFSQKVAIQDGATLSVSIPALAASGEATTPPVEPTPATAEKDGGSGFPFKTVGWITIGAGVIAMGIGGYFGASAISKKTESIGPNLCNDADRCTAEGANKRYEAQSAGNTSTALFVVGGILAAGGIALVIVGSSSSNSNKPTTAAIAPAVGHDRAGLSLTGSFW